MSDYFKSIGTILAERALMYDVAGMHVSYPGARVWTDHHAAVARTSAANLANEDNQ